MPILTRNVTGADVLAIRKTVSDEGPISKDALLDRYFPGDASDPHTSDQRKPIEDAIEFLVEAGQITDSGSGYELTATIREFDDTSLALLHGLRTADGEDAAYNNLLEYLLEQSDALVDRNGKLLDDMNDRVPSANWNETKLRYCFRVLSEIGVTKEINGNESTTALAPSRDLVLRILAEVTSEGPQSVIEVLADIDEMYLPVGTSGVALSSYFERALLSLDDTDDIKLSTVSDIGQSVEIGDTRFSAIEVLTNE